VSISQNSAADYSISRFRHSATPIPAPPISSNSGSKNVVNRVLTDVVEDVMEIDDWDVIEYDPPAVNREPANSDEGRQATFKDVITT
jgi:hypothetical protein